MRDVKCKDCAEYRDEWCEKVIDSPYPDMLRDCQYFREKVIRCKQCKFFNPDADWCKCALHMDCGMVQSVRSTDYCSFAEVRDESN